MNESVNNLRFREGLIARCDALEQEVSRLRAELKVIAREFTAWWCEHHDNVLFFNRVVQASDLISDLVKAAEMKR